MVQIFQKWDRILGLFFENSNKKFTVREISKKIKLPSSTVQRYLEELRRENLITKENKVIINSYFRFLKSVYMMNKIYDFGLVDYLEKELVPETIILFGGIRKGDYDNESDIDLFVSTTKKKRLDLSKFEKELGHKIEIFIEKDIRNLQPHLLNNVINGIKLSGYFKVK